MNGYRNCPAAGNEAENNFKNKFPYKFILRVKSLLGFHNGNNGSKPSFHSVFGDYRKLLDSNNRAIGIIAELNNKLGGDIPADINYVKNSYAELCQTVNASMENFDIFTQNRYQKLRHVFHHIDDRIKRTISGTRDFPGPAHSNSAGTKKTDAYNREKKILQYIAPLNLVDPMFDNFTPEACRTIHDIIRFMHVRSVCELTGRSAGNARPVPIDYFPAAR